MEREMYCIGYMCIVCVLSLCMYMYIYIYIEREMLYILYMLLICEYICDLICC